MTARQTRRITDHPERSGLKRFMRSEILMALGLLVPVVQLARFPEQGQRLAVLYVPVIGWQVLYALVAAWQIYAVWRDFPPVRKPHRGRVWAAFASSFCWFLLAAALVALAPGALLTHWVCLWFLWTVGICLNLRLSEEV
jgi:hypothetical protein